MATLVIVGAGMMGSALAVPLADRGHDVRLVGTHLDEEIIASLKARSFHPRLGLELPRQVRAYSYTELGEASDGVEFWALGVSSAGIAWASEQIAPHYKAAADVFMITKGLVLGADGRLLTLPDVVQSALPEPFREQIRPAAIAGPCIAGELARRVPTCVTLAGRDAKALARICDLVKTDYYVPFATTDVVGAEVCAALKNAYAMGIGFAAGMHEASGGQAGSVAMHNLESATMAQAVFEMAAVVTALGGKAEAAYGLAGVGDLDVTTNGGRTGRFGRHLGRGLSLADAIAKMEGATLECLEILEVLDRSLTANAVGGLTRSELPLLAHLIEVGQGRSAVALPLTAFFGGSGQGTST